MIHVSNLWKLTVNHREYQKECTINKSLRFLAAIKAGHSVPAQAPGLPQFMLHKQVSLHTPVLGWLWQGSKASLQDAKGYTGKTKQFPILGHHWFWLHQLLPSVGDLVFPNSCAASPSSISRKIPLTACATASLFLQTRAGSLYFLAVLWDAPVNSKSIKTSSLAQNIHSIIS